MEKWENPSVCLEHVRQAHTAFDEEGLNLGGGWKVLIQRADQSLPDQVTAADFPDQKWEKQTVPAPMPEAEYLGEAAPSGLVPLGRKVPERTPISGKTAVFRRSFRLPSEWQGRPVIVRFEGAGAGLKLWVNGSYAGMSKCPLVPNEFDITEFVRPDKNHLCVQLIQYADTTRILDRNQWLGWGLWDEVTLYSLPVQRIDDLSAQAVFSEDGKPVALKVQLLTHNAEGLMARVAVMRDNKVAFYGDGTVREDTLCVSIPCPGAALWSPEHPELYRIAVILSDGVGIYHTRQLTFGFRQIQLDSTGLRLNGRRRKLFGAEYRSHGTEESLLRQDLETMKTAHMNALWVRTPMPERFYELCDETGMLVVDDSCLMPADPVWEGAVREMEERLIRAHRSHPSIVLWGVQQSAETTAAWDETRPVCESFFEIADPTPERLRQYLAHETIEEKPAGLRRLLNSGTVIPKESYSHLPFLVTDAGHTLGNGSFAMTEFAELLRSSDQLCGLFLWNWADQSRDGLWVDGCLTGLVSAQGTPHELLRAVRSAFHPLEITHRENQVTVVNHDPFHNLKDFTFACRLTRDGEPEESFELSLSAQPGASVTFPLELRTRMYRSGHYAVTLLAARNGTEYGCSSWELTTIPAVRDDNPGGSIRDEEGNVVLRSEAMAYTINRATGNLDQICCNGQNLLTAPLSPEFSRPATEFDRSQKQFDEWDRLTLRKKLPKPSVFEVDHMTRSVTVSQNVGSGLLRTYRLYTSGALEVELRLRTGKTAPARIGMSCGLPAEYAEFSWLGLGPWDTYPDRTEGARYGLHTENVGSTRDLYPVVQEYGSKMEVRELTLTREDGTGLRAVCPEGLCAGARSWSLEELTSAGKTANLPQSSGTTLCLDGIQNGLSRLDIQPHTTYTYRFLLEPVESGSEQP